MFHTQKKKFFEKDFHKILPMGGSAETLSAIHNAEIRWSTHFVILGWFLCQIINGAEVVSDFPSKVINQKG